MWVAHLADQEAVLPGAAFTHPYVISGTIAAHGHELTEGDDLIVRGSGEVLVWLMDRAIN